MEPGKRKRLRLKVSQFLRICEEHGYETSQLGLARRTGLNRATISRLLSGRQVPGDIIIASILGAFPDVKFEELFEVVDEEEDRALVA